MLPAILLSALAVTAAVGAAPSADPQPDANAEASAESSGSGSGGGAVHLPLIRKRVPLATRIEARNGRPRPSSAYNQEAVYSNDRGTMYSTWLEIGTPEQSILATIDTGSSALLVAGDSCPDDQCDSRFKFKSGDSSSFKAGTSSISRQFADGASYTGTWATDTVAIANYSLKSFDFGLISKASGGGGDGALSRIGIGLPSDDPNEPQSWAYQLATKGGFYQPLVAMYFGRLQGDENGQEWGFDYESGVLSLGGIIDNDPSFLDGDITYVPLARRTNMTGWPIAMDGLTLAGRQVAASAEQTANIDSGTAGIVGPADVVATLYKQIKGAAEISAGNGTYLVPCTTPNFNVTVSFSGVDYPVYWGDLMEKYDGKDGMCVGGIVGRTDLTNEWTLGDVFMRNVYTVFRYDPPGVGFGKLQAVWNNRPNVTLDPGAVTSSAGSGDRVNPTGTLAAGSGGTKGGSNAKGNGAARAAGRVAGTAGVAGVAAVVLALVVSVLLAV